MAFHFENNALAIADIDDARVFTGAADHLWAGCGQGTEPFLGGLVGTMLVPHGREDAKLGEGRLASDDVEDTLVFVGLEAVSRDQLGSVIAGSCM